MIEDLSSKFDNLNALEARVIRGNTEAKKTLQIKFKHQKVYEWQRRNKKFEENFQEPKTPLGDIDISKTVSNKGEESVLKEELNLFVQLLEEKGILNEYQEFIKDA